MENLILLRDAVNTPYRIPENKVTVFRNKTKEILNLGFRSDDYYNALDLFFEEFKDYVDYNYTDILFDKKEPWGGRARYILI